MLPLTAMPTTTTDTLCRLQAQILNCLMYVYHHFFATQGPPPARFAWTMVSPPKRSMSASCSGAAPALPLVTSSSSQWLLRARSFTCAPAGSVPAGGGLAAVATAAAAAAAAAAATAASLAPVAVHHKLLFLTYASKALVSPRLLLLPLTPPWAERRGEASAHLLHEPGSVRRTVFLATVACCVCFQEMANFLSASPRPSEPPLFFVTGRVASWRAAEQPGNKKAGAHCSKINQKEPRPQAAPGH